MDDINVRIGGHLLPAWWACLAVALTSASSASCTGRVDVAEAATGLPCDLGMPEPVVCNDCLVNSSVVNSFPLNGLHVKKCSNPQSVRMEPRVTWSPPRPACNGAELRVVGDRLTTNKGGACAKEDNLVGSTFRVRKRGGTTQTIKIAALRSFTYNDRVFHGYVFTAGKNGASLCNRDGARTFAKALGLGIEKAKPGEPGGRGVGPADRMTYGLDDVALVYTGELYDQTDHAIVGSRGEYEGERWFNIACARDALAKLDIYGIEPHGDPAQITDASSSRRSAGLKMIVASYCGDRRFTGDGAPIRWAKTASAQPSGTVIEAYWNKDGATCLGRSRLLRPTPDRQPLPEVFNRPLRTAAPTGMSVPDGVLTARQAVNEACGATQLADCASGAAPAVYDFVTFVDAPTASAAGGGTINP